jgi:hypothetical protein
MGAIFPRWPLSEAMQSSLRTAHRSGWVAGMAMAVSLLLAMGCTRPIVTENQPFDTAEADISPQTTLMASAPSPLEMPLNHSLNDPPLHWAEAVPQVAIALVNHALPTTQTVTLYPADASCSAFMATPVELPRAQALERAVGQLLGHASVQTIPITGYRVEQRLSGTVRVDLRFAPDMAQSVYDLSRCEQFALFGSIRATLLQNPQWQVSQVIFTQRGKELAF